jgi:5-amino-6-(5-phosphoribosylamino)uracil reductase
VTSDRRRTADGPSPELERACAVATIVDTGCDGAADVSRIAEDLCARGINRLMVEGGGTVLTQFLTADLVDELHLVVAPMFVGDSRAPRLVGDGRFRGIPTAGRTWPACGRSVTWRC